MDVRFWIFFVLAIQDAQMLKQTGIKWPQKCQMLKKKKTDIVTWLVNCIINTVFA